MYPGKLKHSEEQGLKDRGGREVGLLLLLVPLM